MSSPMIAVTVDDKAVGSWMFESAESGSNLTYAYNVLAYANDSIVPINDGSRDVHNITVMTFGGALFDYAMYSYVSSLIKRIHTSNESCCISLPNERVAPLPPSPSSPAPSSPSLSTPVLTSATSTIITSSATMASSTVSPTPSSSSRRSNNVAAVAGAMLGTFALLSMLFGLFMVWRRRKQRGQRMEVELIATHVTNPEALPDPFPLPLKLSKAEDSATPGSPQSSVDFQVPTLAFLPKEAPPQTKDEKDELTKLRERLSRLEAQQRSRSRRTTRRGTQMTQSPPPLYDQLTLRDFNLNNLV